MTFSLYLHIPFCSAKCDYCDFYSIPVGSLTAKERERVVRRYIDALLAETERRCAEIAGGGTSGDEGGFKANACYCSPSSGGCNTNARYCSPPGAGCNTNARYRPPPGAGFNANADYRPVVVPTVYIGGGTPSLLEAAGITTLMRGLEPLLSTPEGAGSNANTRYRPLSPSLSAAGGFKANTDYCPLPPDGGFNANACYCPPLASGGFKTNSDYRPPPSTAGSNANAHYPAEITVEANPESADGAFLEACAVNGINRLSLGVQSFDGDVRRAVGRRGGTALPVKHLAAAAEIFGPGLSLDMMSGLPGQDRDILFRDIDRALSFGPGHVSLYALTVEEGTRLALSARAGRGVPGGDEADELWLAGRDALVSGGFEHYEVSNFARVLPDGRSLRCAHNIRYWRMENWIGVGPAASGTIIDDGGRGRRISYAPDADGFVTGTEAVAVEELDRAAVLRETFLMGFRFAEGPDPALFRKRFGVSVEEAIPETLEKWRTFDSWEKRVLFLNAFLLDAFSELDNSRIA